jgi:endo-1,4-beta-D-glucanase Y
MRTTRWAALALLACGPAFAAPNHPFGSHPTSYTVGAIQPAGGQAALDQATRNFYDAWKQEYLLQTCGAGRYVVAAHTEPGNLTVSEAHGYGMIIAALMAGHDPDAQAIFDGMYAYFKEHPTLTHADLMAFYQRSSCADAQGTDSASDGDLDIAFALLLADKQWGSCGAVDYLAAAQAVIADLVDGDLDASGRYVLLGDWVSPSEPGYYDSTRSSDFITGHFRTFAAVTGNAAWTNVRDRTYQIVAALQAQHPSTGLLPDFVTDPLGTPDPAPADFLESPTDGMYSFNACRDPWRLATDWLVSGDARAKAAVTPINSWIRATTSNDPSQIGSGYRLNGTPIPDTDEPHLAFVAPFAVGAMVDSTNQAWLNALWAQIVATPVGGSDYYGNTLKLLAMLVLSNNWWAPENVGAASCTPPSTPYCTAGGAVGDAQLRLKKIGGVAGDESLTLKGRVFFPQGIPIAGPLSVAARIVVEDLGAGGATVFDVRVPSASDGTCDARDGWKATVKQAQFRLKSGAVDPPVCTPGSGNGLVKLRFAPRASHDVDVQVTTKRSTIGAFTGPLRATVVLGTNAGECGVSPALACSGTPASRRCEE